MTDPKTRPAFPPDHLGEGEAEARSIRPGDPDHPAEQVKRAGRDETPSRRQATYQSRITLYSDESFLQAPTVAWIENLVKLTIERERPGVRVSVSAIRTDA